MNTPSNKAYWKYNIRYHIILLSTWLSCGLVLPVLGLSTFNLARSKLKWIGAEASSGPEP